MADPESLQRRRNAGGCARRRSVVSRPKDETAQIPPAEGRNALLLRCGPNGIRVSLMVLIAGSPRQCGAGLSGVAGRRLIAFGPAGRGLRLLWFGSPGPPRGRAGAGAFQRFGTGEAGPADG